jgi:hypothetical protein
VWRWRPFTDPAGVALEQLDPRAFNNIAGGGGRWAAQIQSANAVLFGSLGDIPRAGAADISPDGTVVYPTTYGNDYGLTIVPPAGPSRENQGGVALWYRAVNGGAAIWPGGADGRAAPWPTLAAVDLRLVVAADGEAWLLYWSEGVGIVLQPDGSPEGYVIALTNGFDNDLRAHQGGVVACLGLSQGEGPADYLLLTASRDGASYIGRQGPPIVWQRLIVPEPPKPEPPDPEPPEPEPGPEPEPPKPEPIPPQPERTMYRYLDLGESKVPPIKTEKCEVVDNGNGTISCKSVARSQSTDAAVNGKPFVCITDAGKAEWRESPGGAFESFYPHGDLLIADRPWNGVQRSYSLHAPEGD